MHCAGIIKSRLIPDSYVSLFRQHNIYAVGKSHTLQISFACAFHSRNIFRLISIIGQQDHCTSYMLCARFEFEAVVNIYDE